MSPVIDPHPLHLTPPETRVTVAWQKMWRGLLVDNPKRTARARHFSALARTHRGRR